MASRRPRGRFVLTFDGKGVVLIARTCARRRGTERRRRHREPLSRIKPGEKKHSKRMATVAAVPTAPFVRSPEDFLESLMPRQQAPCGPARWRNGSGRVRTGAVGGGRGGDAGSGAPGPRARQALGRGRRGRAAAQPRGAGAAAYGVVTVILGSTWEYVWKAGRGVARGAPSDYWAWTRVRSILEGKATPGGRRDAARGDRRRRNAGRQVRRLPGEIRARRPLPRGGLSHRDRGHRRGVWSATGWS